MSNENQSLTQTNANTRYLWLLFGALVVLLLGAVFRYGPYILAIAAVAYGISLAFEVLISKARKKPFDPSWMITPLVFTMLLPPTAPLWMVGVGSGFGIFFGKLIFGGYGNNVFNPAAVGALFLTVSFPVLMATRWYSPASGWFNPSSEASLDAITSATPLIQLNAGTFNSTLVDLLLGGTGGSIGEAFRLGAIILGIALIVLKVIDWRIPVAILGSFFIFTALGHLITDRVADPINSLFVGGLLFGAFFMATEPVTAPKLPKSKIVYGIGIAFIVFLIRNFGAFPEGVIFAIIIMNAVGTLLDSWFDKPVLEEEVSA